MGSGHGTTMICEKDQKVKESSAWKKLSHASKARLNCDVESLGRRRRWENALLLLFLMRVRAKVA